MAAEQCGQRFRRTMYEAPGSRVCTKPPHEGGRHSDNGHLPKKVSTTPDGTCPCCFRKQKARDTRMVLHGYQRPGYGYIVGDCFGVRYAPFEVSCDGTKAYIARLSQIRQGYQERLAALQARPANLTEENAVWVGYNAPSAIAGRKSVYHEVARDAPATMAETEIPDAKVDAYSLSEFERLVGRPAKPGVAIVRLRAYDRILAEKIGEVETSIARISRHISDLEKKVAEWKPVAWPVVKAVA